MNKSFRNILTYNVTALNEIIYAWAKLSIDKFGVPQRNMKKKIENLDGKFG